MELRKKSDDSFDVYIAELSMGEIKAILAALGGDSSGPVADEMRSGIEFYLARLPIPGQSKKEAEVEQEKVEVDRADSVLPEPPKDSDAEAQPAADEPPAPTPGEDDATGQSYEDLTGNLDSALPEPPSIPNE